jgi:hypothetical protein
VNLHAFTAGSAELAPPEPGPAGRGQARPVRRRTGVRPSGIVAAGGGSTAFVPVPLAWRATSRQVYGLFPWGSPGQLPLAGAPIGRHQRSRAVVCFDYVSWFRAHRIANPSVLIISKPGLGKSTLSSKLMLWLAALGYVLLIPGPVRGCGRIRSSLPGSPAAGASRSGSRNAACSTPLPSPSQAKVAPASSLATPTEPSSNCSPPRLARADRPTRTTDLYSPAA